MVTAALLAQAGHNVLVLERYPGLYNLPRAAIFDDETMRTFARLGIASQLLPKLRVQRNYEWRNGPGICSSTSNTPSGAAAAGPSGT